MQGLCWVCSSIFNLFFTLFFLCFFVLLPFSHSGDGRHWCWQSVEYFCESHSYAHRLSHAFREWACTCDMIWLPATNHDDYQFLHDIDRRSMTDWMKSPIIYCLSIGFWFDAFFVEALSSLVGNSGGWGGYLLNRSEASVCCCQVVLFDQPLFVASQWSRRWSVVPRRILIGLAIKSLD